MVGAYRRKPPPTSSYQRLAMLSKIITAAEKALKSIAKTKSFCILALHGSRKEGTRANSGDSIHRVDYEVECTHSTRDLEFCMNCTMDEMSSGSFIDRVQR